MFKTLVVRVTSAASRPLLQLLKGCRASKTISVLYHQSHLLIEFTEIVTPAALVGVFCAFLDDPFHRLLQDGIDHTPHIGQIGEVFSCVIGKDAVPAALSQNEDAP